MTTKILFDVRNKKGQCIARMDEEPAIDMAEHIGGSVEKVVVEIKQRSLFEKPEHPLGVLADPPPASKDQRRRYVTVPNGWGGTTTVKVQNTASDKQMTFIKKLIDERKDADGVDAIRLDLNTAFKQGKLTKTVASGAIEKLLTITPVATETVFVKSETTKPELPDVPEGRYAFTNEQGVTAFCQVDRPQQGKWAGYVFVKLLLGSPGSLRQERLAFPQQKAVLAKIDADGSKEAMLRFGRELGICGACNSPLTNPDSIAAGIGPVCSNKRGW